MHGGGKEMRFIFIALGISSLVSCASPQPIIGPDGTPHQLVTCGSIQLCYKEAREACQGNYKIINTSNETVGDMHGGVNSWTKLLVKCENESKTEPSPSPSK